MADVMKLKKAINTLEPYVTDKDDFTYQCQHDKIYIGGGGVRVDNMTDDDVDQLDKLGFWWDSKFECWISFT